VFFECKLKINNEWGIMGMKKYNILVMGLFYLSGLTIVSTVVAGMPPYGFTETVGRMLTSNTSEPATASATTANKKPKKVLTAEEKAAKNAKKLANVSTTAATAPQSAEGTMGPVESVLGIIIQIWSNIPPQTKGAIEAVMGNAIKKGFNNPEVQQQMGQVLVAFLKDPAFVNVLVKKVNDAGFTTGTPILDQALVVAGVDQLVNLVLEKK